MTVLSKSDILKILGNFAQINYNNFEEHIQKSIIQLETEVNIASLNNLQYLKTIWNCPSLDFGPSVWKVICVSLECLIRLKESLQKEGNETDKLLSVAQQKSVRTLLDQVISVGLTPNLLPGVEPHAHSIRETQFSSDLEKYECLCLVTLALIDLYHNDTFHGILLPQFLSPVLCALCQLTMVPLKKSADTYSRLKREREIFQQHLEELLFKLYQPMVIKELMVIEGNKKSPKWLKRGVGQLLTRQLHRPKGVLAIVQAVRDAANCTAPTTHSHLESVAQVITSSHDLSNICPQVLDMLDSSDAELVRVAVLCIKTLHCRDSSACETYLLQPMMSPLKCTPSSEQQLSLCLQRLHKCFAVPASDFWCLPSKLLQSHINILFHLYCKIHQSVSHIRLTVEDLIWCFLSKCDETSMKDVLCCLIYQESIAGALIDECGDFVFGEEGGVKLIHAEQKEQSLEDFGDCLMILIERRDVNGILGNKLFVSLLEFAVVNKDIDTVDFFEKQLLTMKLLAVLSENELVQKSLTENPEPVVSFLKRMIDSFLTNVNVNVDVISIVLVLLNVILNDFIYSKKLSWNVFSQLEVPLSLLKSNTSNKELRLLAEEAYDVIMTHGAVKQKQSKTVITDKDVRAHSDSMKSSQVVSGCEEALREACDELLPVRGHAIMQLGKLLASGDKVAKAKKEQILCIFQENLKHEDSFLYLSAIEGLAVAAAEFPDSVIVSLTEQYSRHTLPPDTRLKVGEALIRVTKLLGDLVPVYKAEMINAFLAGTRNDDFLVRASSLSNLGELCRVLGFRVGPIVFEVLQCAHCIVRSDPSVEVRRAAVMFVNLLLKGLQKDALTVLKDVLLELYRTLKHIYSNDKDDVTRLHAQLALEELNSSTLAFLFPKPALTKQIFVLDPP